VEGHLHVFGQRYLVQHLIELRTERLEPVMQRAGLRLAAVAGPQQAAFQRHWSFDGLQNISDPNTAGRAPEHVSASATPIGFEQPVAREFLENLGEERTGELLDLGYLGEWHHVANRTHGQHGQAFEGVFAFSRQVQESSSLECAVP
jgi:hypothetical protein